MAKVENKKVFDTVKEFLGVADGRILTQAKLEDLGADPLDILEIIMTLEEDLMSEFPDRDYTTVGEIDELYTKLSQ